MSQSQTAAASASDASQQEEDHLEIALRALDAQPRDNVEALAGNEIAMRPPKVSHQKLTRDQYVLRQWIWRDQLRMQADKFSHQQLTAHEVMPLWLCYELKVDDKWHPARIVQARTDGRSYRVAALVDQQFKHLDAKRQELRPVAVWSPEQIVEILQFHSAAGVFTDPMGVYALADAMQRPQIREKP